MDHRPVEDRFTVFMFANLQKRRVLGRANIIAGRIELKQTHLAAGDLAAKENRLAELHVLGAHRRAVLGIDRAYRAADQAGGVEHRGHGPQGLNLARVIGHALVQQIDDGLADRQVTGGTQGDHAVGGRLPYRHFLKCGDIVDTGVGARVSQHNQAVLKSDADAIGHDEFGLSERSRRSWLWFCSPIGMAVTLSVRLSAPAPRRIPIMGAAPR